MFRRSTNHSFSDSSNDEEGDDDSWLPKKSAITDSIFKTNEGLFYFLNWNSYRIS